jgi:hypothetical protein
MDIRELKESNCIIFECISGSRAYGLTTETSDVDIRGVYILPRDQFYSFDYQDQISDERNNQIYYELRKFLQLLAKNNPSMLEMLNIPSDCVLHRDPLFDKIKASDFVSQLCKDTFAGYAMTQIKQARGLNKKILNPMDKKRKSILDFCYVLHEQGSISLLDFLNHEKISPDKLGLVVIPHMRDMYKVFYSQAGLYAGVVKNDSSMEVTLSSVPKGEKPIATLSFNKDGYTHYCRDYKEYWHWVENRNEHRFQNTTEHGKNYDAKNMMHVFRLLAMAKEIGRSGSILVRQSDCQQLLKIKKGDFLYEELLDKANAQLKEIEAIYQNSSLPEKPDLFLINCLLVEIRKDFYLSKLCF